MKTFLELLALGLFSFLLSYILTPVIRNLALRLQLTDIPNYRKVHSVPIPLIGGIVMSLTFFLIGSIVQEVFNKEILIILSGSYIMLAVGIIDDKKDLRALYKLGIELCLSFLLALYGIRITSFYGIFGIYQIPVFLQYFITVLLITGAINAFNLMDGVDGLAGSIALSGFLFLLFLTIISQDTDLAKISIILIGSLISFLRFNFSINKKIFLGDSGSLSLGFLLISLGIYFIKDGGIQNHTSGLLYLLLVFLLPIFDFVRVFTSRLMRKTSPLKADKTHLHHYLLQIGLSHKEVTTYIVIMNLSVLITGFFIANYWSIEMLVLCIVLVFFFFKIIGTIRRFQLWKNKIKEMEQI